MKNFIILVGFVLFVGLIKNCSGVTWCCNIEENSCYLSDYNFNMAEVLESGIDQIEFDKLSVTRNITDVQMSLDHLPELPREFSERFPSLTQWLIGVDFNNLTSKFFRQTFPNLNSLIINEPYSYSSDRKGNIFKTDFLSLFPNLEKLTVGGTVTWHTLNFRMAKNLKELSLNFNDIDLSGLKFSESSKLESILVDAKSRSETIPQNFFGHIKNVKSVTLLKTKIKQLPENLLSDLTELQELQIAITEIEFLPENFFKSNWNLATIDLSSNLIREIPENAFESMKNLTSVVLENNKLSKISDKLFEKNPLVENIDLSRNKLEAIPQNLLANAGNLTTILLNDNEIEGLHKKTFANNKKLKKINAKNNKLRRIDPELFKNLPQLTEIDFSSNQIHHLPSGLFKSNKELTMISFQRNKIEELSENLLDGLENLRSFSLFRNRIKVLPNVLKNINSIIYANFEDNPIIKMQPGFNESFYLSCMGKGVLRRCYDSWTRSESSIESGKN